MFRRRVLEPFKLEDECAVKQMYGGGFCVLQFRSEETLAKAEKALSGFVATPSKILKVKRLEGGAERQQSRGAGTSTVVAVKDATTEWHAVPYQEQLERKRAGLVEVLRKVTRGLCKEDAPEWARRAKKAPCCPLEKDMVASPRVQGYRNKVELTIGYDEAGRPCVGFNVGRTAEGTFVVADPTETAILSDVAVRVCGVVQDALEHSPLMPYNRMDHTGCWRMLLVRSNERGQALVGLQYSIHGLDHAVVTREIDRFCQLLTDITPFIYTREFSTIGEVPINISWEKWHAKDGEGEAEEGNGEAEEGNGEVEDGNGEAEEDDFMEEMLGLKFRISPSSFFQVNTLAAAELFSRVGAAFDLDENTVVLDLYCGTGTIGLSLARNVHKVIGVEIVEDAVNDAIANAKLNGFAVGEGGKIEYYVGPVEQHLEGILAKVGRLGKRVVAIVDPARPGLHVNVCRQLRAFRNLHEVIYVSCNQNSFVDDAIRLCKPRSKKFSGIPFKPINSFGVDLFPLTHHTELVCLFKRDDNEKASNEKASNEKASNEKA